MSRWWPIVSVLSGGVLLVTAYTPGPYPLDIFQEMHYTAVQRREEPNRAPPPVDSVPRSGATPRLSFVQAAQRSNPLANDPHASKRGEQLVRVNCAVCHGPGGSGHPDDVLARYYANNPAAPIAPPAFESQRVRSRTDGQLYWIVAHGLGNMPAFQGLLTADDLWAIVSFVRQQASS